MGEFGDARIGAAERERALADLSEHFGAGRLSVAEFEERTTAVAAADTRNALLALFADLPPLSPRGQAADPQTRTWDWRLVTAGATPVAAVTLSAVTGHWLFLLLIPAVGAAMWGRDRTSRRLRLERRRTRELDR
jgi:hypothetical protein